MKSLKRSGSYTHTQRTNATKVRELSCCEHLESRTMMSAFSWSASEVYLSELVNRARANPTAEAALLGVDLTQALTTSELAHLVPQEPLALNAALTRAARAHAQDMATRAFFSHVNPDGKDPTQRATDQGYSISAGENIAAGYSSIDAVHKAWLESLGHRKNVLSLFEDFDASFHYDEFGPGFFYPTTTAPYTSYFAQEFGYQGSTPNIYLLGVIYTDTDSNNFYGMGEGLVNVRIDIRAQGSATIVGTYTTDAAGNYQIALPAGSYSAVMTDLATGLGTVRDVTINDVNVKSDATAADLITALNASNVALPGAAANGSANTNDQLTVTTRDALGNVIVFRQNSSGAWTALNLTSITGSASSSGEVVSWNDAQDSASLAAAPTASGLFVFRLNPVSNIWTGRNLTTEIPGSAVITSELTVFVDVNGLAHVAGLTADGHIVTYDESTTAATTPWTYNNISVSSLQANGQETPQFVGGLVSYVTQWNGMNITGLDDSGAIQVVWWAPGMAAWRTDNLSVGTGAPALSGGLTAYLTSWGGINLAGIDTSGKLSVTWWVPSFGGTWVTTNLSDQFSGPALQASSVSSYVTPWGGLNVSGLDQSGKVVVYWWAPGLDNWNITPLTDAIAGAGLPSSQIRGVTSAAGTINLLGVNSAGHVIRYWWRPGLNWTSQDLTELT